MSKHPNNRFQKLAFLVRQQKKSKVGYLINIVKEHGFNLKNVVDIEWQAYIDYLADREEEMRKARKTKPVKV